jgi:hypothetical protein
MITGTLDFLKTALKYGKSVWKSLFPHTEAKSSGTRFDIHTGNNSPVYVFNLNLPAGSPAIQPEQIHQILAVIQPAREESSLVRPAIYSHQVAVQQLCHLPHSQITLLCLKPLSNRHTAQY